MKLRTIIVSLWIATTATAASPPSGGGADTLRLTGQFASPCDIRLEWTDAGPASDGYVVEWRSGPTAPYIKLRFLPANRHSFVHRRLMPKTTCYYRIRAIHGPASADASFSLPATLSDDAYRQAFSRPEDYTWAGPRTVARSNQPAAVSIRRDGAAAAPLDLAITPMRVTVSAFELTWTDRASDAEGNLVEIQPEGAADFHVCAVVGADVNSFGWALTPPLRRARLRIRAFYFGAPSNVVELTTGADPAPYAAASRQSALQGQP